jgi:hypothetical protein
VTGQENMDQGRCGYGEGWDTQKKKNLYAMDDDVFYSAAIYWTAL